MSTSQNSPNPYASSPLPVGEVVGRGLRGGPDGQSFIDYEVTLDDLLDFSVFHHFQSRQLRWQRGWGIAILVGLGALIGIICVPFLVHILFANQNNLTAVWLVAFLIALMLMVAFRVLFRQRNNLRRIVKRVYTEGRNDTILGWHRATLTTQQLLIQSENVATSLRWAGVEKVIRTPSLACCYYSAVHAVVIPLRAFADEAEIQRFFDMANELVRRATAAGR